jgi:L-threonylcarbamoyladenylate synthase
MSRAPEPAEIEAAVAALARGELIGLPTETVYGLAGDASNADAVRRIFALKDRPANHPLIVHLAEASQLEQWAREVPPAALELAARFWPGPMTLILRRAAGVSDLVTGGQDSVGVRVPAHPTAQAVLQTFGRGLAAPSANRFGHVSPTTAQHVREEFGAELPLVLDGGPCEIGIESTIVDLTQGNARVLRPGRIGLDAISSVLGVEVALGTTSASPRASGTLASHYAPRTPAELIERTALARRLQRARQDEERVALLVLGPLPAGIAGFDLPAVPEDYARHLYAALRTLDNEGADRILIEAPPLDPAWAAVRDRLTRACASDRAVFQEDMP